MEGDKVVMGDPTVPPVGKTLPKVRTEAVQYRLRDVKQRVSLSLCF